MNGQDHGMLESDASLADYDALFASFLWEE